jgi:hypothetical protein
MVKRLAVGVLEGGVAGASVAVASGELGLTWGGAVAYGAAALVGVVTGLVAGRPIWAKDAKAEGLLKALIGAFIAATVLFGIRKWLSGIVVSAGSPGSGRLGDVPLVALPVIGVALALVLEIDDAFTPPLPPPALPRVADAAGTTDDADEPGASERRAAEAAALPPRARRGG